MTHYRVGRHQPNNIYRVNDDGTDSYIGAMFSPEDGPTVVTGLNLLGVPPGVQVDPECNGSHVGCNCQPVHPIVNILDLPMRSNHAATVREYLTLLLIQLWKQGSDFSGKRPLGESSWQWDIYDALARGGYVTALWDDDGYLDDMSESECRKADALILECIEYLGARND